MKALAFALALFPISIFAQHPPAQQVGEEVNLGVKAYRAANYKEAVAHFKRAALLDPTLCNAKLYLATAYAQQYVPGVDAEDNVAMAANAIEQYQATLKCQPGNVTSLKGIAYLNMQMKKFDESRQAYREALKLDDKDPELYYSVGVIDWAEAYRNTMEAKANIKTDAEKAIAQAGQKHASDDDDDAEQSGPDQPFNLTPACAALRARNLALVEDGIQVLTRAIELRPNYDDAMAYMNLLYRQRAEIDCNDPKGRKADERKADEWVDLAMQARKKKADAAKKCTEGAEREAGCQK